MNYDRRTASSVRWELESRSTGWDIYTTRGELPGGIYETLKVRQEHGGWRATFLTKVQARTDLQWRRLTKLEGTLEKAQEAVEGLLHRPTKHDLDEAKNASKAKPQNADRVLDQIRRAIKDIYGVRVDPRAKVVHLSNFGDNIPQKLKDLDAAIARIVPVKGRAEEGEPLMVISALALDRYGGVDVTLTTNANGRIVRRFPTKNEYAMNPAHDMW